MLLWLNRLARTLGAKRDIQPEEFIDSTPGLTDLDPIDLYFAADEEFGIVMSSEEINSYTGVAHLAHMRRDEWVLKYKETGTWTGLARFILPRLRSVPLQSARVLGKRCGEAGAYFAIRDILEEQRSSLGAAMPSDRIAERLRGRELLWLWPRLRWLAGDSLPDLWLTRAYSLGEWAWVVAVLSALASLICFFGCRLDWAAAIACVFVVSALLARITRRRYPLLPAGVDSMKDLAHLVWATHLSTDSICEKTDHR
ncbi:MAG: hypothetical protein FLDDKLPJ_02803 [Phycisphaerae bacterium]|nr:hypothetical protein [Phycisphaerae bacterium]